MNIRYALLKLLMPKDRPFVFLNAVSVTGNFTFGTSCIVRNCVIRHDAEAGCTVIEPARAEDRDEVCAALPLAPT